MKILILAYHRVYPGYHTEPDVFEWQIKTLKNKFVPITLEQTIKFIKGEFKINNDGFVITFDDGWADNFFYAYPILKKYNIPATIFIPTNFIADKRIEKFDYFKAKNMNEAMAEIKQKGYSPDFLTWEEINQMKSLIQIESHGHNHLHHPKNSPENIKNDLEKSIEIIFKKTGRKPKYLAWPYGEYDEKTIKIAAEINFEACLTTKIGTIKKGDNLMALKRFPPPRRKKIFTLCLKRKGGMNFYRLIVDIYELIQKKLFAR